MVDDHTRYDMLEITSHSANLHVSTSSINEIYYSRIQRKIKSVEKVTCHRDATQRLISSDPSCNLECLPSSSNP